MVRNHSKETIEKCTMKIYFRLLTVISILITLGVSTIIPAKAKSKIKCSGEHPFVRCVLVPEKEINVPKLNTPPENSFCIVEHQSGYQVAFATTTKIACKKLRLKMFDSNFTVLGNYQKGILNNDQSTLFIAKCENNNYITSITNTTQIIFALNNKGKQNIKNCVFSVQ